MIIDLLLFPLIIVSIVVDVPCVLLRKTKYLLYQISTQWRQQLQSIVIQESEMLQTDVSNQITKSHLLLKKTINDMIDVNLEAHKTATTKFHESLLTFEHNANDAQVKVEHLTSQIEKLNTDMRQSFDCLQQLISERCTMTMNRSPKTIYKLRKKCWHSFLRK